MTKPADVETRSAAELLQITRAITESAGLRFWIDQGTLLGAIREQSLLPWETDVDLSMWADDFEQLVELRGEFERRGVSFDHQPQRDALYLALKQRGSLYVDIAPHRRDGDVVRKRFSKPRNSRLKKKAKRIVDAAPPAVRDRIRAAGRSRTEEFIEVAIPAHWFESFKEIEFLGVEGLLVPADVEGYLAYKYGDDWRVPRQQWDFFAEDGAIRSSRVEDDRW